MYRSLTRLIFCALALVAGVASSVSVAWASNIIYLNDFDQGVYGDIKIERDCNKDSFALTKSPARTGTSVRVLNDGTRPCIEPNGELKHRKEIQWGAKIAYSQLNSPYWFGFSMFIPKDFPTKAQNSDGVIVAQWIGGSYGPELSFQLAGGEKMLIRRDWSKGKGDTRNEMTHAKFPIEKGVWIDWVIYRERSWNSDGVLKIWKNGVKVLDFVGPTAINYVVHGNGGNVKFRNGIYWGTKTRNVKYKLYFDNIRTSDVANGYNMVSPSNAAAPPRPPSWD